METHPKLKGEALTRLTLPTYISNLLSEHGL